MAFSVNIGGGIAINQQTSNNLVSNGENNQFGWSSHQKRNYSYNTIGQFFTQPANFGYIFDNDVIDSPIGDSDLMSGFTNQTV